MAPVRGLIDPVMGYADPVMRYGASVAPLRVLVSHPWQHFSAPRYPPAHAAV